MVKYCKTSLEDAEHENKIGEAHPEVIARMKEIEIHCFNL